LSISSRLPCRRSQTYTYCYVYECSRNVFCKFHWNNWSATL